MIDFLILLFSFFTIIRTCFCLPASFPDLLELHLPMLYFINLKTNSLRRKRNLLIHSCLGPSWLYKEAPAFSKFIFYYCCVIFPCEIFIKHNFKKIN